MKVLVACEFSGVVTKAFRDQGHESFSCDLSPSDGQSIYHIRGDIRRVLSGDWDMMIAFPPCTHLCVSGARYWKDKEELQEEALCFVRLLMDAPIEKIAIENPIGRISSAIRKPDQIIQPWHFGHAESKATCLWLKNLPKLTHTETIPAPECGYWNNQTPSGQNKLGPSPDRAKIRSTTYRGIAEAMSHQWGGKA